MRDPFPARSSPESTVMRFCHEVILYGKFISLRVHVHGNDHEKKMPMKRKKKESIFLTVYKFIFFFLFLFFSLSFSSRSSNSCLRFNSSSFSFSNSSELLKCNVYLLGRKFKTLNDWMSETDLEKKLPLSLF